MILLNSVKIKAKLQQLYTTIN